MFFDASTPDTSAYMIAGYAIFSVVAAIYILSLIIRTRNLQRDREALEGLRQEQELPAAPPAPRQRSQPARKPARQAASTRGKPAKKTARKTSRKR